MSSLSDPTAAARPPKIPESVLVVIHTAALDVLLIERADPPGYWQSVTGSKDTPAETFLQTCVREVYEIYPRWRHRYAAGVTHNTEHVFALEVPAGTPVVLSPREHTAQVWLPWREAADKCFSPSNAEAILHLPRWRDGDFARE
jgi:dATP pyrophosphohydrolase